MAHSRPDEAVAAGGSIDAAIIVIEAAISELMTEFGSEVEELLRTLEGDTGDSVAVAPGE